LLDGNAISTDHIFANSGALNTFQPDAAYSAVAGGYSFAPKLTTDLAMSATDPTGLAVSVIHGGINILSVGDINGDGKLDVISSGLGNITWWENPGTADGPWIRHTVYQGNGYGDVRMAFAADMNGDGKLDIVSSGFYNVSWWENSAGDGSTWVRHTITTNDGNAQSITMGDINGDGHPDLFSFAPMSSVATWYENDGSANPRFTPHAISFPTGPGTVSLGDLTGNGRLDAIITPVFGNEIDWFLNWDGQFPLPTSNPPAPYLPPGSGNLPPGTPMSALLEAAPAGVIKTDTRSSTMPDSATGLSSLNTSEGSGPTFLPTMATPISISSSNQSEVAHQFTRYAHGESRQVLGLAEALRLASIWDLVQPLGRMW